MIYRCILASWVQDPYLKRTVEGEFTPGEIEELNGNGYNIYYLPNYPSLFDSSKSVDGSDIDVFKYVFIDMDLKDGVYKSKESFIDHVLDFELPPTKIIDSGNGVHVYWEVADLDALNYLMIQRRLTRRFRTDEAVGKIFQLMRVPNTVNPKHDDNFVMCKELLNHTHVYTCEQFDKYLPLLNAQDEEYCKRHFNQTYKVENNDVNIQDKIPLKFSKLMHSNPEVKTIWAGGLDDRSKGDYRLGHIMYASGFTRDEAISVLVNSAKALQRAPTHRANYAINIVDKIWAFEQAEDKELIALSQSVRSILEKSGDSVKGTRFPCWSYIDATSHGFRLGQVIGLVAGSGVGKTAIALNMFMGFVQNNPDYDHIFIPLEQPANEIADRWKTMCGDKEYLYDKVHVISNYADSGSFRHLSLGEIKDYILRFQETTGRKIGCVVIDHIGALKKKTKDGETQGLMDICHEMKAFAVETNTMLVMQSQAPREKAGIGDLELNKDAAYGTVYFESYCDYLITMWQPLKRCYSDTGCPTVTAFKFCKIRHKKVGQDKINEDVCYRLYFDTKNELLRELTQNEEKAFDFWNTQAINRRKLDKKTDVIPYQSITWTVKNESRIS